jgi:hypothetical protein
MTPLLAGKDAIAGAARAGEYARHRPEQTLLYQLVEQYYPAFVEHLSARERTLPVHVQREFEAYLKCGRLEHGLIPGILPSTPSGPAFGCLNTFLTYLSACSLRGLSRRATRGVQLQATRLLRELRCAPDG